MNPLTSGASNARSGILSSIFNNQLIAKNIQTQLATNKKLLDPAQQGVVTRLTSQVTSYAAANNNIAKAQNVLNVAATGLSSTASLLTQMQDLATKANDATMTAADRAKLNKAFQSLLKQIDSTANASKIDSVGLLASGSTSLSIQTGITAADTTSISAVPSSSIDLFGASPRAYTVIGSLMSAGAINAVEMAKANVVAANATTANTAGLAAGAIGSAPYNAAVTASNNAAITANQATFTLVSATAYGGISNAGNANGIPGAIAAAATYGLSAKDIAKAITAAPVIDALNLAASNAAIVSSNAAAITANAGIAAAAGTAAGAVGSAASDAAIAASNAAALAANAGIAAAAGAKAIADGSEEARGHGGISGASANASTYGVSAATISSIIASGLAGMTDISTTAGAAVAMAALKTALDRVSTSQSSIAADQMALNTVATTSTSISQKLQNTIDSIQKPDAAALQMQLQEVNNQQSMNYYLINQMVQESQGLLSIFR